MNDTLPTVTVVIPARPDQAEIKAATAARGLDYPAEKLEIIVARGKQPSAQRNAAIRAAHGELIYFLDDDSVPIPENLRRGVRHFGDPKVQMAGGPNLCPREATTLEHIFALVLSSWLAFGPSRSRYARVGTVRETSEKELILCNQLARRQVLLELGGFNEVLYPNEENALMDEVQKRGGKLIYDPDLIVYRRPRSNLKSFARMLMTYGRGRAEQLRAHPTLGSAPNLAPPLLLVYLVLLPFIYWLAGAWGFVLLGLYVVALAVQASALPLRGKVFHALAAIPLIVLTHLLYGFGFWRGLFTKFRSSRQVPAAPVVLETVGVQYRDVGTV